MSGEKTEKPSDKKLRDAREKGQVSVSKDLQVVVKLMAFYMVFFALVSDYPREFSELIEQIVELGLKQSHSFSEPLFSLALQLLAKILVPLVVICALAGMVSTWAQIGFIVSFEPVMLSFKKFDAVSNLKNMLSKKSLVQLLISVCKVVILALVGFLIFKSKLSDVVYSYRAGLTHLFDVLADVLQHIIFICLGLFVALALIDWVMERMSYIKNLRMSKHDIKDEQKETIGNPEIRKRRRREHRSILNSSLNRVGGAKAVVANPTHIAVALDYEPGKHDLPFILAMGTDDEALRIRQEATKKGIPVIVNVKLARMLYQDCEEDEYIQKAHLELAAEVFRTVMQMAAEQRNSLHVSTPPKV